MTVHVREATRQRLGVVRRAADKQGIDLNAMMDQAVSEVFEEVLKPASKSSAFSNGSSSATTGDDA
jgi:hypothetical protein